MLAVSKCLFRSTFNKRRWFHLQDQPGGARLAEFMLKIRQVEGEQMDDLIAFNRVLVWLVSG